MQSEAAFEDLYRTHYRDLLRYCVRKVRNRPDAEDALQDTMLRAHSAWNYQEVRRPSWSWLTAIATNVCRDVNLRHRRQPALHPPLDAEVHWLDDQLNSIVRKEVIAEAWATLPHHYSQVLILRHIGGFGHKEIAEITGVSQPSARNSLQRAKRALAKSIEQVARKKETWPLPALVTWRPWARNAFEAIVPAMPSLVLGLAVVIGALAPGSTPVKSMIRVTAPAVPAPSISTQVSGHLPYSPLARTFLPSPPSASHVESAPRNLREVRVAVDAPSAVSQEAHSISGGILLDCDPPHGVVISTACQVLTTAGQ